jgi:hypothetical protein
MNSIYKIFVTVTFLITLPIIIVMGIYHIWKHQVPIYPPGYLEDAKKAQQDAHLQ